MQFRTDKDLRTFLTSKSLQSIDKIILMYLAHRRTSSAPTMTKGGLKVGLSEVIGPDWRKLKKPQVVKA